MEPSTSTDISLDLHKRDFQHTHLYDVVRALGTLITTAAGDEGDAGWGVANTGDIGRVVDGRYRLVADLGSGGFGRVWKAHDEDLNVDVAVKEVWLPPTASQEEQAERLTRAAREARNAAQLRDHPNVVAVHDVIWDHDVPWIVMQLVDGHSLAHQLATQGPLSVDQAAQVATALLRALKAADQAAIVHRDVKPGNVLITTDGQVLLTDFGLAVHEADTRMSSTGMVVGSMAYLAPERANGQEVTVASDLFSLGVTLYEAVEGMSPFRRDIPIATLAAIVSAPAPLPQRAGRLAPLIMRLLEKKPDHRPTIAQALELASTPPTDQQSPSASAEQPPSSWLSRRWFLTAAGGVTAAGAVTAAWLIIPRSAPPTPGQVLTGHTGPAATALGQPLTGHTAYVRSVAFSPDGHTLASGSEDNTIRLWDLTDPRQPAPLGQPLTAHTGGVSSVAFSPDGHTLASGSKDNTIRLWDLTDPRQPAPLDRPLDAQLQVFSVAFSSDGRTLAGGVDTVRLWDLANPRQPAPMGHPFTGLSSGVFSVAFSHDGHTLASGGYDKTVRLWDLANPRQSAPLAQPLNVRNSVSSVAFSPDGRTLASGVDTVRLWDLANPRQPAPMGHLLTGHTGSVSSVAFSPDGRTLASGGDTILLWDLANPRQPAPMGYVVTGHTGSVSSVAFSPDGRTLASGGQDKTVRLWDVHGA